MRHVIYQAQMEGITTDRSIRDSRFDMGNKHWHPECEIQYILEGSRCFFIDDQTHKVGRGGLVIIDSEQIHRTTAGDGDYHDRILVLVEKSKLGTACQTPDFDFNHFFEKYRGAIQIPTEDRERIEHILTDIASEINRREVGFEIIARSRLLELFLYVMRFKYNGASHKEEVGKNQLVYEVAIYIKDHYNESKSLDDISNKFFVDKCYLSRIFKSVTGFTVNEYINVQRIRQAQILLEDTSHSIMEIAEMTGYENVTYFSRIFRKYIETTPLKYRKKKMAYRESIREKSGL